MGVYKVMAYIIMPYMVADYAVMAYIVVAYKVWRLVHVPMHLCVNSCTDMCADMYAQGCAAARGMPPPESYCCSGKVHLDVSCLKVTY